MVTATLVDGYEWRQLSAGWGYDVDRQTATCTVELAGRRVTWFAGSADGGPGGVCRRGGELPTLKLVTPTRSPTSRPGSAVCAGRHGGGDGEVGSGRGRLAGARGVGGGVDDHVDDDGDVDGRRSMMWRVGPWLMDPGVVQATCAAGVVTAPSVTPTPVEGISYSLDPQGPYDGTEDVTVTVTATLADGFEWRRPVPVVGRTTTS